jgi:ABC-type Fe3+-hydroxamate transport system substrate-binding protein
MREATDQCNRIISLPEIPSKIISLVPSQTELLYDLDLGNSVIGITKFCVHPREWFSSKTRVGGTKQLNIKMIHQLAPDLIIANKEENRKEQIEELAGDYPVWVSNIQSLTDALQMIREIGLITKSTNKAAELITLICNRFLDLAQKLQILNPELPTAYFIWKNPYMAAGADTFISHMMKHCGFKNIFEDTDRYPETSITNIRDRGCRLLLLSSEPFPFKEKDLGELTRQLPDTKIMLVDGELFSWYGSRLKYMPAYFEKILMENGLAISRNLA